LTSEIFLISNQRPNLKCGRHPPTTDGRLWPRAVDVRHAAARTMRGATRSPAARGPPRRCLHFARKKCLNMPIYGNAKVLCSMYTTTLVVLAGGSLPTRVRTSGSSCGVTRFLRKQDDEEDKMMGVFIEKETNRGGGRRGFRRRRSRRRGVSLPCRRSRRASAPRSRAGAPRLTLPCRGTRARGRAPRGAA
jgi:hypothetical protein